MSLLFQLIQRSTVMRTVFLCEADLGASLECRRGSAAVHLVCSRYVSQHTTEPVCVTVDKGRGVGGGTFQVLL